MKTAIIANINIPTRVVELPPEGVVVSATPFAGGLKEQSLSSGFPHSPSFPANEEAPNVEKLEGISPSSLLCERSREAISSLGGFDGGIGPENWFHSSSLWVKRSDFNAPSLLNLGIGPEKELFTKLMVLRPRSCCNASISIVPERPKSERWRPVTKPSKQMAPTHLLIHGLDPETQSFKASARVKEFLNLRRASSSDKENERLQSESATRKRRTRKRTTVISKPEMGCSSG
ncbi:hypothetical protein GH714_028016 [Hevea brasiliensis]|uniref:Uncharacterized protein n=1 Tax=Hevea brasiliensis TaxID=3981 RepID=A0A6A6LRR9_HEVBR|nr:hypothetical protein GH714_028016 [Hevea brasiliensis]